MRCGARGLALIAAMLLMLVGGVAAAQDKPAEKPASKPAEKAADKPADDLDALREKLRADKRLVVAEALELTEKEAQAFWPVYNAYQSDMVAHYDRILKLLETYAGVVQVDDRRGRDPAARRVPVRADQLPQHHHVAIVPSFQRVLPPKKVARLYQLENKIRALVDYQLAQEVPLIK